MTLSCLGQFTKVNRNCLVVITLHTHVIAELDSMTEPGKSYFQEMPMLDLSDVTLTHQEKEEMLRKHLARSKLKLDAKELNDVITRETVGLAFPWSCKEYVQKYSRDGYENLKSDADVFQSPSLAHVNFFRRVLQDPENWKDLVPLFVLVMNGSGALIGQKEQTEVKLEILGMDQHEVDFEGLIHQAVILRGSFLNKDNNSFKSRALCDAFGLALFQTGSLGHLVQACDLKFFVQHLHTKPQSSNTVFVIHRTSKHYNAFLVRVSQEILNGNVVQISQHPALQNGRFLADFDEFLHQRNTLKVLLSARDPRHDMPLLYWSAWCKSGHLTQWCLSRSVSQEDGRILRRTFLACCLFGEKVTSPRVADMLEMLCEDSNVLNDAMSDVSLPVPPEEARLDQEVVARCDHVLKGSTLLFCGQPTDSYDENTTSTIPNLGDTAHKEPRPKRLSILSTTDSFTLQTGRPQSQVSNLSSISITASSSARQIPLSAVSESRSRSGTLSTISEFQTTLEAVHESRRTSLTSEVLEASISSLSPEVSVKGTDLSTQAKVLPAVPETHLQSGIPVPPSIIKVFVDKEEGKLMLQPMCARWYTIFRLLSMCGVDEVNRDGYTLLHIAAFNGEMNMVQFLVESGADMTRQTPHGNTPLTKALDRNQVSVASHLLRQERKMSVRTAEEMTLTMTTTTTTTGNKDHHLLRMLGTCNLQDILLNAVLKRRSQALALLLSHGAEPQSQGSKSNRLLDAARSVHNNNEVITVLMEHDRRKAGGEEIYATPMPEGSAGSKARHQSEMPKFQQQDKATKVGKGSKERKQRTHLNCFGKRKHNR